MHLNNKHINIYTHTQNCLFVFVHSILRNNMAECFSLLSFSLEATEKKIYNKKTAKYLKCVRKIIKNNKVQKHNNNNSNNK